jgi:uncharacterized protein YdeI (BOF family)
MRAFRSIAIALALGTAAGLPAAAQEANWKRDGNWITLEGLVTVANANSFQLDYGDGRITVEMDDWDRWSEGLGLKAGDIVTVTGRVDRDLFETASIEAEAVFVKGLNTYFYANPADEEDTSIRGAFGTPRYNESTLRGEIVSKDAAADSFLLDTGLTTLTVDTSGLGYNPLDNLGSPQLEVGDDVYVIGSFDDGFFTRRALIASRLIKLEDAT